MYASIKNIFDVFIVNDLCTAAVHRMFETFLGRNFLHVWTKKEWEEGIKEYGVGESSIHTHTTYYNDKIAKADGRVWSFSARKQAGRLTGWLVASALVIIIINYYIVSKLPIIGRD